LWLFYMGNILQEYLGPKKILPLYVLGSMAGAWLYILAYNVIPAFKTQIPFAEAYGASAGVTAILVAVATLLPNYEIRLMFIGSVRMKWIALVYVALDLIMIPSGNAGGHIAHLGGALFGFFYIVELRRGNDMGRLLSSLLERIGSWFRPRKKRPGYAYFQQKKKTRNDDEYYRSRKDKQQRVDEILDKISKYGYEKLTAEEKAFLFQFKDEP